MKVPSKKKKELKVHIFRSPPLNFFFCPRDFCPLMTMTDHIVPNLELTIAANVRCFVGLITHFA